VVVEGRDDLMHAEAMAWVAAHAPVGHRLVLDAGGRDINGNPQDLFDPTCGWEVVDLHEGPGVTVVGDILDYHPDDLFDVALCLEVAEHTADWPKIIAHIADLLTDEGLFIFTAAGPGRAPHSAIDGGPVQVGEFYQNVDPETLAHVLDGSFSDHLVDVLGPDVRAVGWK
jgi:hypothetical protein